MLCQLPGVERMTRDDVDLALGWAASEGWNPGFENGWREADRLISRWDWQQYLARCGAQRE